MPEEIHADPVSDLHRAVMTVCRGQHVEVVVPALRMILAQAIFTMAGYRQQTPRAIIDETIAELTREVEVISDTSHQRTAGARDRTEHH